jgi:L-arabinose isomerase
VNLAPLAENKYELIVSAVEMLDVVGENNMQNSIHGWFKPAVNISDFLESYSKAGGTHHAVLVYGDKINEIAKFGEIMGWDIVRI